MKCFAVVSFSLGLIAAALFVTGCESSSTSESAFTLEPGSATLTGREGVTFTAVPSGTNNTLFLPLAWEVDAPGLGTLRGSAGVTAVYTSNGSIGSNVITARDASGREAIAVVNQVRASDLAPAPVE
jgi:hypothetical protein